MKKYYQLKYDRRQTDKYTNIFTIIDDEVYCFMWSQQKWILTDSYCISDLEEINNPFKIVVKDGNVDNTGIYIEMLWGEIDV